MKMPAPEQHVDYEPCPAGTHAAVCSRLIDLGTQKTSFQGQTKYQRKIYLEWELPAERMTDGRPFAVGQRYTFSSSPKATLRQHLEAWRGRRFEDDEIEGFELRDVLRKPCLINVVHQTRGDRTYADIASLSPLPRGMQPPTLEGEPVYLSLEADEYEPEVFASLSEKLRETIARSPEHADLVDPSAAAEQSGPARGYAPAGEPEDDIPF